MTPKSFLLYQYGHFRHAAALMTGGVALCLIQNAIPAPAACIPAPPGLVSWWRAEGNALDAAGTNPGTLMNGAGFTNGIVGQAFILDGTSQYVSIPDSPSLRPTNFTVEGWVSFTTLAPGYRHFITKTFGSAGSDSFGVAYFNGALITSMASPAGDGPVLSYAWTPVLGTWYHIAYTLDVTAGNHALYVNGAAVATGTVSGPIVYDNHPVLIGADINYEVPGFMLNGLIDEVSLYRRALNAAEIKAIYDAGSAGKCTGSSVPVITSVAPGSGFVASAVTISGTNFSPVASSNIVYFGAVRAGVISASSTSLTVSVPAGATFAPITVTVNGLVGYAPSPFKPSFPGSGSNITVSSFAPGFNLATPSTGINDGISWPRQSIFADLDGDGKPDLIIQNGRTHNISIFQNISAGGVLTTNSFAARVDLPAMNGTTYQQPSGDMAIADVDGDGKLDIVVCDWPDDQVLVYRNISTGGTLTTNSFAAPVGFGIGSTPISVRVADLDGDGRPDLIVSSDTGSTITILQNVGAAGTLDTNSFVSRVVLPTGNATSSLVIADLDGDGKPDIALAYFAYNTTTTILSLFRNQCSPGIISSNSFAARVDLPALPECVALTIGDLDGDGKPDLVVGYFQNPTISVYRNLSSPGSLTTSSFAARVDFPTPGWVGDLALGDLSGDGKLDICEVGQLNSAMSVYQNLSSPGSFSTASLASRVDFASGWNVTGASIGDLDGDGRPEIVFCNFYDDTITIYQNLMPMAVPQVPHRATATARLDNGFVVEATITDGGFGYTNAPLVL